MAVGEVGVGFLNVAAVGQQNGDQIALDADANTITIHVPEAELAKRKAAEDAATSPKGKAARAKALEPRAREAIAACDAQGRWLASASRRSPAPQITTSAFIENLQTLCHYLEAVK